MIKEHDIYTDEGNRLLTCIRDNDKIILYGKGGYLSIEGFMYQIMNPAKRKQRKK